MGWGREGLYSYTDSKEFKKTIEKIKREKERERETNDSGKCR